MQFLLLSFFELRDVAKIFYFLLIFEGLLVSPNIGSVKGDPLLPFLFKLRFSSALRDGIGVFKPISLFH